MQGERRTDAARGAGDERNAVGEGFDVAHALILILRRRRSRRLEG